MDTFYEDRLFAAFPEMFPNGRNVDPINSLMCFGFECRDGWFNMIFELCQSIEKECKRLNIEPPVVHQVKEKFGGLRFYTASSHKNIYEIIRKYEELSYTVCEVCGASCSPNKEGWIQTLCKIHRKK